MLSGSSGAELGSVEPELTALGSPPCRASSAAAVCFTWLGFATLGAIGSDWVGLGLIACSERSLRGFGPSPLRRAKPIAATTTAAAAKPSQMPGPLLFLSTLTAAWPLFLWLASGGSLAVMALLAVGASTWLAVGPRRVARLPVEATAKLSWLLDRAAAAASNLAMLASLMRAGFSAGSASLGSFGAGGIWRELSKLSPPSEEGLSSGHSESISSVAAGSLFETIRSADASGLAELEGAIGTLLFRGLIVGIVPELCVFDVSTSADAAGSSPRAQSSSMSAVGLLAALLALRLALPDFRNDFPAMNL